MNYRDAGVNIEAGENFVRAIAPLAKSTYRPGMMGGLGGFGAVFDPKAAGYSDPLLVTGTDGVGTKLLVAIETGRHDKIGIDLVAMCVNDLVVHGAEPLFFLDYYASGALDPVVGMAIVQGIAEGCRQSHCALVGGETAEMPGLYPAGDYDLAGFAVGAVERHRLLPQDVQNGDVLLGLSSSGAHSNGYSLIRRLVSNWDAPFDPSRSFADVFLTPTRIYVKDVLAIQDGLHAMAHITGGGLIDNLPRVMPEGLTVRIDQPWEVPAEFHWIREAGALSEADMLQTFNCGIGMVLVVAPEHAKTISTQTNAVWLGHVIDRKSVV